MCSLLGAVLQLGDLGDTEAFCNAFLDREARRNRLEQGDRDDALAYLISETWRLSTRYDAVRYPSFGRLARTALPSFFIQWQRDRWVDKRYQHADPASGISYRDAIAFPDSLDITVQTEDGDVELEHPAAPDHSESDSVAFTVRAWTSNPGVDCDPGLAGLFARGPCPQPADLRIPRSGTHR